MVNQEKVSELRKEIDKVNTAVGTEDKRAINFVNITEKQINISIYNRESKKLLNDE